MAGWNRGEMGFSRLHEEGKCRIEREITGDEMTHSACDERWTLRRAKGKDGVLDPWFLQPWGVPGPNMGPGCLKRFLTPTRLSDGCRTCRLRTRSRWSPPNCRTKNIPCPGLLLPSQNCPLDSVQPDTRGRALPCPRAARGEKSSWLTALLSPGHR
ncbi:hypothetical protein GQ53DRAFT_751688 [Thozetella sp. PMI_491]|nr:hypothetical protein GQ53DRAFT_751688 [Thozetella sp. PMI_491]